MSDDVVITAEGLGKKYRIQHQAQRHPYTVHRPLLSQPSTTEPPFKVQGSMLDVGCSMFGPDLPNPQPPPVRGLVVHSPVVPFLLFQEMHYLPENVLYGIFAAR